MRRESPGTTFQADFHRRWGHLSDPHVRALAWLLYAPDLLDPGAAQWDNKIATLDGTISPETPAWLAALDRAPLALHTYLALHPFARLGRYAEKLMAFYFEHTGQLFAHGVQVRAGKTDTIGEFDFLLIDGGRLLHWEFATKFYLLESNGERHQDDYFVGPNLADTLGAKMRKILGRQLALGQHPAAQIHLPQPIASAQALVKGWLFYHASDTSPTHGLGLMEDHCHGFWATSGELEEMAAETFAILPRLSWLAPARLASEQCIEKATLQEALAQHFASDTMPVMVAVMAFRDAWATETARGFIVPDDWRARASVRIAGAL